MSNKPAPERDQSGLSMLLAALLLIAGALLPAAASVAEDPELDPASGLRMTGDWELVRNNCNACHSTGLITQTGGTADQWLSLIRWMQAEQNLWPFEPNVEARIIAYLAENYPSRTEP